MAGQSPAGGKSSNRGPLGCLLAGVLLFGGCTAYFAIDGNAKDNAASSSAGNSDGTPAAAPATSATASSAQMLADLDGDTSPVGDYQAVLDALAPKCTQDEYHIAALGYSGYNDLAKNGVHDETRLTVLQHLDQSIPASLGKTDCVGMMAAYLTLRETS